MALTSVQFIIKANPVDGKQRLSDPDGVYEPAPGGPEIQPVSGLQVVDNTHNSQTLAWSYGGAINDIDGFVIDIWPEGESDWTRYASVDNTTFDRQITGLSSLKRYQYRVASAIEAPYQLSPWSEVEATTIAAPSSGGSTVLTDLVFFKNFEHLSPGDRLSSRPGEPFTACGNMTCSNARSYAGNLSAHSYLDNTSPLTSDGYTGWGDWGFEMTGLPVAYQGCEVWWRIAVWWPPGTDTSTGVELLKQQRMGKIQPNVNQRGASELGVSPNRNADGSAPLVVDNEWCDSIPGHTDTWGKPTSLKTLGPPGMKFGEWAMMEQHVLWHVDETKGKCSSWINGVPVERITTQTWPEADDETNRLLMHTYWNGGIVRGSRNYAEVWYDQIAVAYNGPTNVGNIDNRGSMSIDINGKYHIGMAINTTSGARGIYTG